MNPNYVAAYALISRLRSRGVKHCVLSPGSRSTPLAFVANKLLDTTVCVDERSSGFIALGISEATNTPALVITTSGSAPTHLHPSVVEAHHSNIPLIIISADRPHELRGIGAPQTIDQKNLFGNASNIFVDTKCPHDETNIKYWEDLADTVYKKIDTQIQLSGVAHINMGMREPLVPDGDEYEFFRDHESEPKDFELPEVENAFDLNTYSFTPRTLITLGRNCDVDFETIRALSTKLKAPVLADILSNHRAEPDVISNYDAVLRTKSGDIAPDTILQFGDPLTSKVFNLNVSDAYTIAFKKFEDGKNPWRNQDQVVISNDIASEIKNIDYTNDSYIFMDAWKHKSEKASGLIKETRVELPESEPSVFFEIGKILDAIDFDFKLLIASSMPVRYAEWFWEKLTNAEVFSHRGTNGIDGMISSSLGIALGSRRKVINVIGDVAFTHDIGALNFVNKSALKNNLSISFIVINNNGGAIFNHLEQANSHELEDSYEKIIMTPPDLDIERICGALKIDYLRLKPTHIRELESKLNKEPGVNVIEVEVEHDSGKVFMQQLNKLLSDID